MRATALHVLGSPTVNRIKLVKPDKARQLGDHLLGMAQKGAIRSKIQDGALVGLLESISKQAASTTVKVPPPL